MQAAFDLDFGFNYLSFFGAEAGARVFARFWDLADKNGLPRNPYRLGMVQLVGVAGTDVEAARIFRPHVEYMLHKGPGAVSTEKQAIPGTISLQGLQALMRDPGDFGLAEQMRTIGFDEAVEAGAAIIGSPRTVIDRLTDLARRHRIGNLHVMLQLGSMPRQLVFDNIRLFASEVLPALRNLWADEKWEHHWWPERLGGRPLQAVASAGTVGAR
jgi:alkanesulfonate monooxygenase SsuD/methylene tetrahydromethanopterin reductase-like flavin-dependent oxidoreductase (luciferase family)